ncbi:11082_t:CDS:2, partial [Gigaspora margarita]
TIYVLPTTQARTTTAQVIKSIHNTGIIIRNNNWPTPTTLIGTSVNAALKQIPKANMLKEQFNKAHVYTWEQMTDLWNARTIEWSEIPNNTHHIPRGCKPRWIGKITPHLQNLLDTNSIVLKTPNPYYTKQQKLLKGHWNIHANTLQLSLCEECEMKDDTLNLKTCMRKININSLQRIMVDNNKMLRGHLDSIVNIRLESRNSNTRKNNTVTITGTGRTQRQHDLIRGLIKNQTTSQSLIKIAQTLATQRELNITITTNKHQASTNNSLEK